jgi:hypothetical protein
MKIFPLHKILVFYLKFLIFVSVFILISCSYDEDKIHVRWTYIGLRHVEVDSIDAPDTIRSTDTLEVYMSGDVTDVDLPLFSHVEEVRDLSQVDLKLWAKVYAWSGSGPMPPTSFTVNCTHKLPPPFYPDTFAVNVHRPDSSVMKKVIYIKY